MSRAETILCAGTVVNPAEAVAGAPAAIAGCVAIADGRIVAIGGPEVMDEWRGRRTAVHDYGAEAAILPGLVDSHTHPVWGSESTGGRLAMSGIATLEETRDRLAEAVAGASEGGWITGYDFDVNAYPGEPSGRVFEEWFPGRKVSLMTRDAHALVVSPAVLAELGLTGEERFADASAIVADADGPTGWVVELQAMDLVLEHYPQQSLEAQAGFLLAALRDFAAQGLTGVHALDFHEPSEKLLRLLERDGELPVRVRCSPLVPADSAPEEWARIAELVGMAGRRWRVEGVKFMLDGTADNGTAWFETPDSMGENTEALWRDTGAYRDAVRFFAERGIPTATHAIGDRAVRFVLDTVAEVTAELGRPAGGPHRIEHIESIPDALLDRFAELGVVAGLQPTHATRFTEPDQSDGWSRRIGPERAAHGWRIRDLIDHGAVVALSSDWPIGVGDPRISLADAQLRRPVEDSERSPAQPGQRITAAEAYRAMTLAPAIAEGREAEFGRIAVGYRADLTVFAADPLALDPEAQAANRVLASWIDGERVVSRDTEEVEAVEDR